MQSFFIIYYWYYWYFLSNNKIDYYNNGNLKSGLSNINLYTYKNYEFFILLKDIGYFQIKYANRTSTYAFLVTNS